MPLDFIAAMRASAASKKGKFSAVAFKQISKALTGMGKTVTGVDYHPDGSFTVMASDPEKQDSATASYWDKVLPK
jgi:3D (Asp-Asp-Asp) domain-containing protein